MLSTFIPTFIFCHAWFDAFSTLFLALFFLFGVLPPGPGGPLCVLTLSIADVFFARFRSFRNFLLCGITDVFFAQFRNFLLCVSVGIRLKSRMFGIFKILFFVQVFCPDFVIQQLSPLPAPNMKSGPPM